MCVRISSAPVQDVPCESSNSHCISADSAFQRSQIYLRKKDLATANCWFYIGGHAGNADALAEYARVGKTLKTTRSLEDHCSWAAA